MLDVLIQEARVADGTGNPCYTTDVGVCGDKIVSVGRNGAAAALVIDGQGLCLSPGFIDPHAHDEGSMFFDPSVFNKLSQGITTGISGNCGASLAPVSAQYFEEQRAARTAVLTPPACLAEFTAFGNFLNSVERQNPGINVGFLVGHSAIRIAVMGLANRQPDKQELESMKDYLKEALDSGALGFSTGLLYPPCSTAQMDELVELCSLVAERDRIFTIHIRNESDNVIESVREAIEIGRRSGVFVNISHLKGMGKANWGKAKEILQVIEEADEQGVKVGFDQYPYSASSNVFRSILPPSYLQVGDWPTLIENLRKREFREKAKADIIAGREKWDNYALSVGFDGMLITKAGATPDAVGKTVAAYAANKGIDPFDAAFDLLAENSLDIIGVYFSIAEEDIEEIMRSPYGMIGTDGIYLPRNLRTHPRVKGTFPRVLGRYVREKQVLRLEEAVRKMTSLPAQRFHLHNKGLIKQGFDADMVLFDPATIHDAADYVEDCYAPNQGIHYVIVNGKVALQNNQYTDARSGKVIRL